MLNYAVHVGMPESQTSTPWSNVEGLGGTYMVTLLPAMIGTIPRSFSGTKGVEKKRYSSTAVRFPLLYYRNRLIVSQFSLRAHAECARPCACVHDGTIVYSSSRDPGITLFSFRSDIYPLQVCPEIPSDSPIFGVNSQKLHKIN